MPRKTKKVAARQTLRRQAEKSLAKQTAKKIDSASATLQDLTDAKRAEEALQRNVELGQRVSERTAQLVATTEQLRAIFDAANDGFAMTDFDGNFIAVNDALVRLHGCASKDELLGRRGADFVAAQDYDRVVQDAHKVVESGETATAEYLFLRKDGSQFLGMVNLSLIRNSQDKPIGFGVITRDLTQQRQAEEALKVSQEYAKNIIDSSLDMIVAVDMDRRITEFNTAAETTFGYRREEVLGKNINVLYANITEGETVNRTTISQGHGFQAVFNRKKNGQIFPSLLSSSVLRDSQGNPIGLMGISRDITEIKRAEEKQKQLFEQIREGREKLKALSKRLLQVQEEERHEIARELHDEIGQAMTSIQMTLQASGAHITDSYAKSRLEDALRIVDQVLQNIRNLSLNLRPSMLDDFGLLPALSWYFETQSARTGLEIQFDAEPLDVRPAEEIETACYRIVQEAITNIIRHANATHVSVELQRSESDLLLTIQDNGVGFGVAEKLANALRGGSMGLLGMQERAHLAGGELRIDSHPGQGTRIHVDLPIDPHRNYAERRTRRRTN